MSICILLLYLAAGGCSKTSMAEEVEWTRTISGNVLFFDDFSEENRGWNTHVDADNSMINLQNDGIRFLINTENSDFLSSPGQWYNNSRLEVDAVKLDGPDDNSYGLICRKQDNDNFYSFLISNDGYFGIVEVLNGEYRLLSSEQLEYHDGIQKGLSTNHLRADCTGPWLVFEVNDVLLARVKNDDLTEGDVGLIAGTNDTAGTDILFDNFYVYVP